MSEDDKPQAEQPETPAPASSEAEIPLPPPTLEYLVFSLGAQAEIQLGLLHFGDEKDRPKPNLPMARHSIDMLEMLKQKTKGNLTLEEQRYLENSVTELQFRYVQVARESGSK